LCPIEQHGALRHFLHENKREFSFTNPEIRYQLFSTPKRVINGWKFMKTVQFYKKNILQYDFHTVNTVNTTKI